MTRELQRRGVPVGRRIVTRLMQQNGISGITRRRNLTKADAGAAKVPDLIRRRFTAPMPGLKLIGDISCFPTGEGWLYLATAVDLCSKVIGYAIAPHMRASLAIDAITAAHRRGLVAGNAIMHTDRGSNTTRRPIRLRCDGWRSGRAPAAPARASTAPPLSPSSPRSRPRSEPTHGPTAPPRAATSRTGSRHTTSGDCIRQSAIGPRRAAITLPRASHHCRGRSGSRSSTWRTDGSDRVG